MKILFINSFKPQCGVYQYGKNLYDILTQVHGHEFFYAPVQSLEEAVYAYNTVSPDVVIVNYQSGVTGFLSPAGGRVFPKSKNICILHESLQDFSFSAYDYFWFGDPNWGDGQRKISIPRFLFEYTNNNPIPATPTFGTFGFAYPGKDYQNMLGLIQDEYDEAIFRIHTPRNQIIPDFTGQMLSVLEPMKKPGVEIKITHEFLSRHGVLDFLGSNTANIFLYNKTNELDGISSVIDYGIACKRPMIINNNNLFRHVSDRPIVVPGNSIRDIVSHGTAPLSDLYEKWSEGSNVEFYKNWLDGISK